MILTYGILISFIWYSRPFGKFGRLEQPMKRQYNEVMRRLLVVAVVLVVAALTFNACGGGGEETTPEPVATPTPAPEATPTPGPSPSPVPGYDPETTMYGLFSRINHPAEFTLQALELAREHKDISQVPVIIEFMRFVGSAALLQDVVVTLRELTGEEFGTVIPNWTQWMEWLGRHSAEYPPPEGYLGWKVNLLSQIDPRFAEFLMPAGQTARINLTEVVWGGVRPDGIPDLQNPLTLAPHEADYLFPDDRVFGVSINGEHRAYPLRIVNAHEMVNDVLGGEPIALAY